MKLLYLLLLDSFILLIFFIRLAMYVYEYLQHCGAREAAKCFLQEKVQNILLILFVVYFIFITLLSFSIFSKYSKTFFIYSSNLNRLFCGYVII